MKSFFFILPLQVSRWTNSALCNAKSYTLPFMAILCIFCSQQAFAQYADCSSAIIIKGNTQPFNPSGVGNTLEQLACGGIEHNSVWLAFQAKASGKLNFVIRPFTPSGLPTLVDVDWSLYALTGAPGSGTCDAKTQLSCNFAGSSTTFGIPGATGMASPPFAASQFNPGIDVVNGNWYVLMIDQFSNTIPLLFSVQFTGNPESGHLNSTPAIFDDKPDFSITTNAGCDGSYNFTHSATAGIASYSWDFGDGSTSTLANPSHTYITTGTYYATLSVTDNNGFRTDIRKSVIYNSAALTMTAASVLTTPSCTDVNNGTIAIATTGATTLGISGGTPPYTYELVSPSAMIRASQSSNVFTGLQPGGYTIKATDACGQTATVAVTVAQTGTNTSIGLGIQNIQSACVGTATGSATIFANGTVPPYTMALVNSSPVTTAAFTAIQRDPITATYFVTFNNLLPGSYTVEAIDACGKQRRATFSVTPSTAPVANTVASASCTTSPTGTLTVTATAATGLSGAGAPGSWQYALIAPSPIIRPFQNGSVFQNLWPGTYTIAVKDACGNIGTATATVSTAGAPTFGTTFTTASCPNGSTGTIEAQLGGTGGAGGGSPYTYELLAPSPVTRPAQNNNIFTGLVPGTYTIRLVDACGTAITTTSTVSGATAPTFTTTLTASCSSPQNGTITVIPSTTSLGPYSFELISPGAAIRPPQGSNIANTVNSIFTGLGQGPFTIRMTDGCGGAVTNTVSLTAPIALAFPTGSTSVPSCSASSTGSITVAVPTTGKAPYQYELIAPSPLTSAPQNGRIFNNLPTGDYTIRITDACGTQVSIGTPLTIGAATTPTLSATNTASCATASGTITALATTANQGGGTYQFSLIAPSPVTRPNQTAPIFTGLSAGAYTVQITDQCGQTGTVTSTVATAGAFTPAVGGSVVACNGSGYYSQITVTSPQNFTTGGPIPTGSGGGPYTYAVYDATNTTLIAGPQSSNVFATITPLGGNPSHTIRVTDACGNTSTTTTAINPPVALTSATISTTTASCAGTNTGVIKVTTGSSGGLPPYQYSLIDATTSAVVMGSQSATTFNLVPANAAGYFVRTMDACGNVVTSATALLFPAATTPTATVTVTPSCVSSATGKILVAAGTSAILAGGTFSYELYDAGNTTLIQTTQASPLFTDIAAGTYTIRIIDRCGNVGTAVATVTTNVTALSSTATVSGTCTGGSNGVITASFTGGSLPVSYSLIDQVTSNVIAGPQSDNIFTGLALGTYIVSVTDACGTVANSSNIPLNNLSSAPTLSITSSINCTGSSTIGAYGGTGNGGPYTYAICSGSACTTFGSYTTNSLFSVNSSGTYRISVADRCGNTTNSSDIVVVIPARPIINSVTKDNTCGPTTVTLSLSNVVNTPYYSVDGGNFATSIGTLAVGTHTILVSDVNAGIFGCSSDATTVVVSPVLGTPSFTLGATSLCSGATSTYTATAISASSITYSIFSGGASIDPSIGIVSNVVSDFVVRATASGCGTNTTMDRSVTVTNAPVFALGASSQRCKGAGTSTYSASLSPVYTLVGGGSSTINASTGEVTWDAAFIGTATITATVGSCSSSHQVTTNSLPATPTITSSATSVCAGVNVTLTGVGTGGTATEFAWFRNGTFVKYSNTSADYTFSALAGTNNYTLVVIHSGNCTSTGSAATTITGNAPVAAITPSLAPPYCVGSAPILNAAPPTGTGYTYSWIGTSPSAATTTTATFVPTNSGNHRVTVTDVNGCSKSSAWTGIVLNALPGVNAGLDKTVCMGSSAILGTAAISGYAYQWTQSPDLSSLISATTTITPSALGTVTYTLTAINTTTGCVKSDDVVVSTVSVPATPSLTTTSSPVCQGATITLIPSGATGAINWYKNGLSNGSANTPAQRTLSTTTPSADNYTIRAKNGTCLSAESNTVSVWIKSAPTPTLSASPTIVGNLVSVCNPGQTSGTAQLMANLPSGAPAATYNWQQVVSGIATNVSPAVTTSSYMAAVSSTSNNKTFRAQVTYSNSCVKNTSGVVVRLLPSTCNARTGDATDLTGEIFTAYPNPTDGLLNVNIANSTASEGKLVLYNALGQIVTSHLIMLVKGSSEDSLDLSGLASGVYTLSFQTKDGNQVQKIVKD